MKIQDKLFLLIAQNPGAPVEVLVQGKSRKNYSEVASISSVNLVKRCLGNDRCSLVRLDHQFNADEKRDLLIQMYDECPKSEEDVEAEFEKLKWEKVIIAEVW